MPLIKAGQLTEDRWTAVADDAPIAANIRPIISLERWQRERDSLSQRPGALGIRLRSDQSPALIADDLQFFGVIALEFPKFTDGRSYSHARLLRDRYGFSGELRAVGNVLRDQFQFMLRCGFDSLEVAEARQIEGWAEAVSEIESFYQKASDRTLPAWALRLSGADRSGTAGSWAY